MFNGFDFFLVAHNSFFLSRAGDSNPGFPTAPYVFFLRGRKVPAAARPDAIREVAGLE